MCVRRWPGRCARSCPGVLASPHTGVACGPAVRCAGHLGHCSAPPLPHTHTHTRSVSNTTTHLVPLSPCGQLVYTFITRGICVPCVVLVSRRCRTWKSASLSKGSGSTSRIVSLIIRSFTCSKTFHRQDSRGEIGMSACVQLSESARKGSYGCVYSGIWSGEP